MTKRFSALLIAFAAAAVIAAGCVYSFVNYTTPNLFKALYAKQYVRENTVYRLSDDRYMVRQAASEEETMSGLAACIGGGKPEMKDSGVRPRWQLSLDGTVREISIMTGGSGYVIVELI